LEGSRSGLWSEFARLIREIRPQYVIVENVPDLCDAGLGVVLGSLAEVGYDAEWDCIPATLVGARHPRERLWLVSYPSVERQERQHGAGQPQGNAGGIFDVIARSEPRSASSENWVSEPAIPRVVDGTPNRAHRRARTNAIGNAVVPQIPELIGRAILQARAAA
jgi:DNA (cytosine-5)-methyltransferase 1